MGTKMSKKCPDCGSLNVEKVFDGEAYCKNCYLHCSVFDLEDASVFDQITVAPEVLAPRLVFRAEYKTIKPMYVEGKGGIIVSEVWKSTVISGASFKTEPDAIAATVEKLKGIKL